MILEVTDEEAAMILDGLAALPLGRSYNTFNRIYKLVQDAKIPKPPPLPPQEGS